MTDPVDLTQLTTDEVLALLDAREQAFVEAYLACMDGTEAVKRVGYKGTRGSLRTLSWQIRKKPIVAEAIRHLLAERAMPDKEVLFRLAEQGRANIADFLRRRRVKVTVTDKDGNTTERWEEELVLNWQALRERGYLVKAVKVKSDGSLSIEMYDGQAALTWIGKHYKMFTENVDITTGGEPLNTGLTEDGFNRSISALAAAIREIVPRAGAGQDSELDSPE